MLACLGCLQNQSGSGEVTHSHESLLTLACKMQNAKCKMQWKEEKIEFQVPVDFYMTSTKVKGEKSAGFTFTGQKLGGHRL